MVDVRYPIQPPVEVWIITNLTSQFVDITDLPNLPKLGPAGNSDPNFPDNVNAMDYYTNNQISGSVVLRNFVSNGTVSLSEYVHTHSDKSYEDHTHEGLDILTAGPISDASSLHSHFDLVGRLEALESYSGVSNTDDFVLKSGSINQLSDITSTGEEIEAAIAKAHNKDHTLLEHIDDVSPYTMANFMLLFNGGNADCLHTHSFKVHNELTGLQGGDEDEYYHLTETDYTNLKTLTDGSNADSLHTHSGIGIGGDHNDLDGLQGGTSYNLSIPPEYYHLDYDQYLALVGGPSTNADHLHTHDLGGYISVQDEGVDICSLVTTINFKGVTVQAKDCIEGLVNVYIPPLTYVSHFNTSDGTNDCTVSDKNTTSRIVSSPTIEGSPFKIGSWSGGDVVNAIRQSSASCSYTSTNGCSFSDNSSTTIEVNIYDADGSSVLASHTTSSVAGNIDVTVDNIRIQVTSWGTDSDRYKGVITVTFNIDTILTADSLQSGRFSVEIIHHDGSGDYTYTQNNIFYDDEPNSQAMGNVTISEGVPVIVYKSGVMAYDTDSTFVVAIDDLDYLNSDTYPSNFVRILGSEYGLSTLILTGAHLTAWTNAYNNINATYSNSSWSVSASSFFSRTTTANITAETIDWDSWGESSDTSPNDSIIIDTYDDDSTRIYEDFRGETSRLESDLATSWDSTISLSSADGDTGLQVGEGTYLFYPGNSGLTGFPTSSGDYTDYDPNDVSQPDYSSLNGTRYYYRGMYHTSTSHSNGIFNITGVDEDDISADNVVIEISLNGTDWFNCNESYLGGILSDGDGCRIDSGTYNLDTNEQLRFTLGQGGTTALGTGPGWGIWIRISMPDTSVVQMNKIEITDWV
jgi:hypothetical protein